MKTATVFSCPARYSRFVEAQIALALAEVARDVSRREDEDPRVRGLATVPDELIDDAITGTAAILVCPPVRYAAGSFQQTSDTRPHSLKEIEP